MDIVTVINDGLTLLLGPAMVSVIGFFLAMLVFILVWRLIVGVVNR